MRRIKLTVAYDGTNYCGWQIQPNALSVQEVLENALADLLGTRVRTIGASRTDAGVHALGNVAVFDTEARMPADRFAFALNTYLPDDIKIQGSAEVPLTFHPQRAETVKTYEYQILNRTFPDPTRRLNTLHWYGKLDIQAMQKAAELITGTHDFAAFASVGGATENALRSHYATPEKHGTVRTIYSSELIVEKTNDSADDPGQILRYRISGNGFLYNMVRIIAGTLIEVGKGDRTPQSVTEAFASGKRSDTGATAPARGLTLVSVRYKIPLDRLPSL